MAPRVCVPMDFGRHLIGSPTHSNLKLNTSEGGEVLASSVILSFNSPVIDNMTTTLHMTSVDMLEFGKAAVQLFVDTAYSGTAEGITQELFRDINKMANVFEVSWLIKTCAGYFTKVADSVKTPSYNKLLYLFEEAAFVSESLKTKDFLTVASEKIKMLKVKQQFIEKYLDNAARLSTQRLDIVIELAGTEVNFVVQKLTSQLSELVLEHGLPNHCQYLLDNSDLSLCRENNRVIFDQLFDVLDTLPDDMLRWTHNLLRRSTKMRVSVAVSVNQAIEPQSKPNENFVGTAAGGSSLTPLPRSDLIPNLYHSFDMNMSFKELFQWLSVSEEVTNLMMAVEAFAHWNNYNNNHASLTPYDRQSMRNRLEELRKRRSWQSLPSVLSTLQLYLVGWPRTDIGFLCSETSPYLISILSSNSVKSFTSTLAQLGDKNKWKFYFKHPSVTRCNLPGECGFIIKTVAGNNYRGVRALELCTEKEDYTNEGVHFHEEIRAEKMHVYGVIVHGFSYLYPLSWLNKFQDYNTALIHEQTTTLTGMRRLGVLYKM